MAIGGGGRGSHNQNLVRARPVENDLVFEGRGAERVGRVVGDRGRAVVDPHPLTSLLKGTACQGGSEMVASTGDTGRRFEMVIADEILGPFLSLSKEVVLVELVATEISVTPPFCRVER